ncbi:MAG: O-antigen ligase family protein [bacterium]
MLSLIAITLYFVEIGGVLILSLMGKIYLSLLLVIPLFPLQNVVERFHKFPLGKDIIDILLIIIILCWGLRSSLNKEKLIEPTPFNKLIIVMAVFTFISLWWGTFYLRLPPPLSTSDLRVQNWKNYMIFILLYFIVVNNIKSIRQIKWLTLAMALSMIIMDYYTVKQIGGMTGLVSREKISGTFQWTGVNVLAAFYAQYILVLLGIIIIYRKAFYDFLFGSLVIVGLYITLFLYSRGAYLALFGGIVVLSLIKKKVILIPLILFLLFWQTILPKTVVERINYTQSEEGNLDSSSQGRLELWKEGLALFKKSPLVGIGFSSISIVGLSSGYKDTHNIYIKILAEQGIIGISIILLIFWLALKSGWKLYKNADDKFLKGLGLGFTACVVATIISNGFGDRWTFLQIGAFFWVFLALVERGNLLVKIEDEKLRRQEEEKKQC